MKKLNNNIRFIKNSTVYLLVRKNGKCPKKETARVMNSGSTPFVICTSRETIVKNCFSSVNSGGKIFQFDVKVIIYMDIKVNHNFYSLNSM